MLTPKESVAPSILYMILGQLSSGYVSEKLKAPFFPSSDAATYLSIPWASDIRAIKGIC